MKRTYTAPQMRLSYFESRMHTADTSAVVQTDGADITERAMKSQKVISVEKVSLNSLTFENK
ncbi:MAG: hypothetical protein Q4G33_00795 [bacterium]|nr:hypothetical protein [bacterium]